MDTVIIKIYGPGKFKIRSHALFLPELEHRKFENISESEKRSTRPYLRRFSLRPQMREAYLPNVEVFEVLTGDRKNIRYILKIQFSLPKLLFGNSLEEISETDGSKATTLLKRVLEEIGIVVEAEDINAATVSSVHFCKNIILLKGMSMREIQGELGRMDISKVEDIDTKELKNGGRVLNLFSGTIEHSFYEKISDCMRPKNKRSDKGFIDLERQAVILNGLQKHEVCRYEYRIKKTQTVKRDINRVLNRDTKTPVIFADLFTPGLYKLMILKAWDGLIGRPENQLTLFSEPDRLCVMLHVLTEVKRRAGDSGHSMNRGLMAYGLIMAMRDQGAKEVKGAIFDLWGRDHPERLTEKLTYAANLVDGLPQSSSIAFIQNELQKFERINLARIMSE